VEADLQKFILCWAPVLLLTVLAVLFRMPALSLSIFSSLFTLIYVVLLFKTPLTVALLASLDGIVTTLPLLLVVFAGIMLSTLLQATGSLPRLVTWFMGGVRDALHRSLLITFGVANFMEGASVIAEPVVAPMLRSAGVSPDGSAALSIVGYAGLMTLEMAGIIVTVLSLVTGIPVYDLGVASGWLSIPATVAMAACVPLFMPRFASVTHQFLLAIYCGLCVSTAALGVVVYAGVPVSGMLGGLSGIVVLILVGPRRMSLTRGILRDLAPFAFMLAALFLVNIVPPLRELTSRRLCITIHVIPVHSITLQPLFSAYLYLFAAFGLAAALLKVSKVTLYEVLHISLAKGWRACVAMGLFGAMGQMIAFSGYAEQFIRVEQTCNIPWILAHGLQIYTGTFYPLFIPLLGWVGTFLTGYGVASIMLFGKLQVQAASLLGVSATWLAAALAVGASIGSISSPFKIAIATPMCGALGQEGAILRWTIPLGIAASLLIGLILLGIV
jgi:lactate permease